MNEGRMRERSVAECADKTERYAEKKGDRYAEKCHFQGSKPAGCKQRVDVTSEIVRSKPVFTVRREKFGGEIH